MSKKKKAKKTKFERVLTVIIIIIAIIYYLMTMMGEEESTSCSASIANLEIPIARKTSSEQIINHIGYTVSYNHTWNIPNWVAYELVASEVGGDEERSDHFRPDPQVYGTPVTTKDYANSGYDRGHMAPAADMKWSEQAMKESFYMTNMCPQCHNLNAGDWKVLEEDVRSWARMYDHIYVCCGPIVTSTSTRIGQYQQIVVPQKFYKVILRQKGSSWTGIGFVMDNKSKDGKHNLSHYAKTINEIEKITNIDFFQNLPDDVEEIIEGSYTLSDWKGI